MSRTTTQFPTHYFACKFPDGGIEVFIVNKQKLQHFWPVYRMGKEVTEHRHICHHGTRVRAMFKKAAGLSVDEMYKLFFEDFIKGPPSLGMEAHDRLCRLLQEIL